MTKAPRHRVDCPHPACDGIMYVRDDMPVCDVPCICKSCTVGVRWANYVSGERKPYLVVAEEKKKNDQT